MATSVQLIRSSTLGNTVDYAYAATPPEDAPLEVADTLPLGLRRRLHAHFDAPSLQTNPGAFLTKLTGLAQLVWIH